MRLTLRRDLECRQAVELVTDYLEGALSRRQRRRFETHIRACPNCSAYLEQIQAVIATSGSITPEDLTPRARDDLMALYRRWHGKQSGGSQATD
jgi:anti-sigma factor RsiW